MPTVQSFYVAEPNPPLDLNIDVEGVSLATTWSEPFFLKGEDLSYVISITNMANGVLDEVTLNSTTYVLSVSEPTGERNCTDYMFTVFSKNGFSKSRSSISGLKSIPTGTIPQLRV